LTLVEAMHLNSTLLCLDLGTNVCNTELTTMVGWNKVGGLSPGKMIKNMPKSCRNRILFIIFIFHQLPICDDMYWIILSMLKVQDFVQRGAPLG